MRRVIKLGGRAQQDSRLATTIADASRRDRMCIVHGGGDEVSAMMRALGREPTFVNGRRVTTADDVDVVRMVLSGAVNKRLVSALVGAGVRAVGISGEDAALIEARVFDGGSLGAVGEPVRVHRGVLDVLLDAGYIPIISPLGRGPDGSALNINGDDAAAAIASALGVEELLMIADVPGVLDANGQPLDELRLGEIDRLISDGTARAGMTAKLEAGRRAIHHGVHRVRISDMQAIVDRGRGTTLLHSPSVV